MGRCAAEKMDLQGGDRGRCAAAAAAAAAGKWCGVVLGPNVSPEGGLIPEPRMLRGMAQTAAAKKGRRLGRGGGSDRRASDSSCPSPPLTSPTPF